MPCELRRTFLAVKTGGLLVLMSPMIIFGLFAKMGPLWTEVWQLLLRTLPSYGSAWSFRFGLRFPASPAKLLHQKYEDRSS